MNPFLAVPAANAASGMARSAFAAAAGTASAVASSAAGPVASAAGNDFRSHLDALQSIGGTGAVTPRELAGLTPSQIQKKLAGLPPAQQITLAQQLVGSTVSVTGLSGQTASGKVEKLQIQNGTPVFQIGGHSYNLANLTGVSAASVA